jgi:hypothetical protein
MRILFALHSHRIGTKVPVTLKRLLQLATLDGAVDLGIADPAPGPVARSLRRRGRPAVASCSPARGQGRSEPWSAAAEMFSALAACNVRHAHLVACSERPGVGTPVPPMRGDLLAPRVLAVVPEGSINELAIERSAARVPDIAS